MANIKEIAKMAGVSSATVSRVINNNGYVSFETRKKVMEVVSKIDYVPNINAVSLKKGVTKMIGVIAPALTETLSVFIRSFTREAQKNSYNISIFMTDGTKEKEIEALEMLRRKQLDGILLIYKINDWDVIEQYTKYGPIVTLQRIDSRKIPSVYMNHYDGYTMALEHLYEKGARKIVNLYGNKSGLNTSSRIQAYDDFCKRRKIKPFNKDFFELVTIEDGERIAHWYKEQKNKPDAFAAVSDTLAAGLVSEAKRIGLNIPSDFSVVGFDDIELSRILDITTINYPISLQAENAFNILYNTLNEDENNPKIIKKLNFKLVERLTT